jgi:general secretion pathway protein D
MKPRLGSCVLAGCMTAACMTAVGYGQSSGAPSDSANASATQNTATAQSNTKKDAAAPVGITIGGPVQANALRDERKSAKLYLEGVKQMEKHRYEEAWKLLEEAAELEPANGTYLRAADLARESAVTRLVQQASQVRARGDEAGAKTLIRQAAMIDPKNPIVMQHESEITDAVTNEPSGISINETGAEEEKAASAVVLEPNKGKHSFHLRTGSRQVLEEVYKAYGVTPMLHDSVQNKQVRFDMDDVEFADAARVLSMVTKTFYEPLDPHRVVVAQDTRENRLQLERSEMETVYLPGLDDKQLTEVSNIAHNVFEVQQTAVEPAHGTVTIRAPVKTLAAFNRTVDGLESGQNQIDLNIKVVQLSRVSARETGTTFLQQTGVSNAYAEINSIIQNNQSAVQQIISSGLVPNANTITNQIEIIAILLSAGQLSGTIFNQGFALFGGGLTESVLSPGAATLKMSLNSSDTRTLEDIHMRLSDEEAGTFKIGERYPIETSSYSSVALPSVSGLSSAASSALTAAENQTIPQVEYEDLGLTVKATPKVMRSEDVALTLDMKIVSLGGSSLNDIPILNNQSFSGVLTLKAGETAVLVSDLSRQESRALSGLPGVSDIPGLEDISDVARNQNVARLLILVTPSVLRGPRAAGHGPRMPVDKASAAH